MLSLPNHDEQELVWFHTIGQTAFERSTLGEQLERAQRSAVPSRCRCPACKGSCKTVSGLECGACDGLGYLPGKHYGYVAPGLAIASSRCSQCRGSGQTRDPEATDPLCPGCSGRGYISRDVALHTGVSVKPVVQPDTSTLERYATTSSRMFRMGRLNFELSVIWGQYWGHRGEMWQDRAGSRAWAIVPMTDVGITDLLPRLRRAYSGTPDEMLHEGIMDSFRGLSKDLRAKAAHENIVLDDLIAEIEAIPSAALTQAEDQILWAAKLWTKAA